jgi:hypothetical protein
MVDLNRVIVRFRDGEEKEYLHAMFEKRNGMVVITRYDNSSNVVDTTSIMHDLVEAVYEVPEENLNNAVGSIGGEQQTLFSLNEVT